MRYAIYLFNTIGSLALTWFWWCDNESPPHLQSLLHSHQLPHWWAPWCGAPRRGWLPGAAVFRPSRSAYSLCLWFLRQSLVFPSDPDLTVTDALVLCLKIKPNRTVSVRHMMHTVWRLRMELTACWRRRDDPRLPLDGSLVQQTHSRNSGPLFSGLIYSPLQD